MNHIEIPEEQCTVWTNDDEVEERILSINPITGIDAWLEGF